MLSYGLGALGLKSEYSIVERTERLGLSFAVITFIPSVSIVVSLIGTFAFMQFMGFSLNLLTLFALVLAIGMVVDDAIIVVEAVQANFDKGYRSPYLASTDAMRSVAMALLTSTIVFMAVFIPVSMIDGTSGAFYRQFGLTMAVAVGISSINAFKALERTRQGGIAQRYHGEDQPCRCRHCRSECRSDESVAGIELWHEQWL